MFFAMTIKVVNGARITNSVSELISGRISILLNVPAAPLAGV